MSSYGDTPSEVVAAWRSEREAHMAEHQGPDRSWGIDRVCWGCRRGWGGGRDALLAYRTRLWRLHIMNLAGEDVEIFHDGHTTHGEVMRRCLSAARADLACQLADDWEIDREAAMRLPAEDIMGDVERLARGLLAELEAGRG